MKTLIKLTVIISLFFGTLYAQNINECKTDIYFGNGVWNSAKETKKSIDKLQYIIDTEVVNNDPKLKAKYGQIKLQYNWGQGTMLDVLETYYQLKEAGQVSDYQFFAVIALLTKGNPTLTLGAVASKELMEPFTRGWEQGNVDDMWQKYYEKSFKLSHKVLLISHSQGNLFANRVYDIINPTGYKDYFANLQIASPASEIKASKGDYVTLSTDLTSYDPVINFIPGSMSPNASGDSGHALVSAYLLQADPLSKITTKIKQLLSNLDTETSQWELDQELNTGTKDYKITLKHRFDTSITSMQDVEVYPFKPSQKLYHVTDNTGGNGWVKATCGGEEVFDSWTGQESNEAYLIDNLEREIIKEYKLFSISRTAIEVLPVVDYIEDYHNDQFVMYYYPYNSYIVTISNCSSCSNGYTLTHTLQYVGAEGLYYNHDNNVEAMVKEWGSIAALKSYIDSQAAADLFLLPDIASVSADLINDFNKYYKN